MNFAGTASPAYVQANSYVGIMQNGAIASESANYVYSPVYYVYQQTGHSQAYWAIVQMLANFGGDTSKVVDKWIPYTELPANPNVASTRLTLNHMQAQGYQDPTFTGTSQLAIDSVLWELHNYCQEYGSQYFTDQQNQWMGQFQHYYVNGGSNLYIPPWPPSSATAMTMQQLIARASAAEAANTANPTSGTTLAPAVAAPSVSPSTQAGSPTVSPVNTKLPPAHPMGHGGLSMPLLLSIAAVGYFALRKG